MYDPTISIAKGVYPYLVKWCLSIGYKLNTNEPHTLLYGITCDDGIRIKELMEEGKDATYTREEAESLVNDLSKCFQDGGEPFTPDYDPPIYIRDDFSTDVFLPALTGSGEKDGHYKVAYIEPCGIYHKIFKVISKEGGPVMDRSAVMALIRKLEYGAVMTPFVVTYNLLKTRGSMSKTWVSQTLQDNEAAQELMTREKERHAAGGWRIYTDVTDIAAKASELPCPLPLVKCDGWLWLRVHHPKKGACGADYAVQGFYNSLCEVRQEVVRIQQDDIYAIFGIYACVHHDPVDPLPEAEQKEEEEEKVTPEQTKLLNEQMKLLKERLTLLEMIQGELGNDVALHLQALDQVVNTKTDRGAESYYFGDQWVRGCRSGMAIALDILTLKVEDVIISRDLRERPIRIRYIEGVEERHVLDESIISEE